ncbi:unnamed protein product [Cuscuta campestris]|uniref:Ubiquitin-like protease family profile domain-containing protein n=1 Tax=Cuscuta campestris TaxID=132261 RepID=A0A484MRQ1_9ASTE|nr:unnamed protein product [Cuscuta campestris]
MCVAGYKFELAETQYDEIVLVELDVIETNTVESKHNEKEVVTNDEMKQVNEIGLVDAVMEDEVGVTHVGGVHTMNNKTWPYDLFMDQEWLETLHIEVGMFYLEVKRFHYKLNQRENCGMFVLKIAEYLMMGRKINKVCTEDMTAYRVKMATELYKYTESKKLV